MVRGAQVHELLTEDVTFYVSTTGSDSTGTGTSTNPYKTILKAFERIAFIIPGNYSITISMGRGIHVLDRTIRPSWPYGSNLTVDGQRRAVATTLTISNIDTAYSTDGDFTNLQYFDCDIDLSGDSPEVAVGYFIRIKDATGGTNHDAIRGLHEIIAWDSGTETATIRVWSNEGVSALPSGSITATTGDVIQTVITWEDAVADHGIDCDGVNGGIWTDIIIKGNQNQFDVYRGLRVTAGGSLSPAARFGVHQFDVGAEIFNNGMLEMPLGMMSKIWTIGASVGAGGTMRFNFDSYMNGCGTLGVRCQQGGNFIGDNSTYVGIAQQYAMTSEQGALISLANSLFLYEDAALVTTACLRSESLADISAGGVFVSGFTTSTSTATSGRIIT
jgi:hypothetical protein